MALALPDEFSSGFQKTKDFVTEKAGNAVNSLTEATAQAKNSLTQAVDIVSQTTEQAKNSLAEAAHNISETASQAVGAVSQTAENAKAAIAQTTNSAVNSVNQASDRAVVTVSEVTEKAKISLDATIQQAEELNRSVSQGMQQAISASLNDWIRSHPLGFWILNHPLQSLAFFLLGIILLGSFIKAATSLLENVWIVLIQAPVKLIRWIFMRKSNSHSPIKSSGLIYKRSSESLNPSDRQERLGNIIKRLDAIKQEQDVLLKELSTLVKSEDLTVK